MDLDQDWKKVMEKAGCPHMSYIKVVKKYIAQDTQGVLYQVIAVYLEKKYPSGRILRMKLDVDVGLLKIEKRPELSLCGEAAVGIVAMDRVARIEKQNGSENNQTD